MSWKLESVNISNRLRVKTFLMAAPGGVVMRTETTSLDSDIHENAHSRAVSEALVFIPGENLKLAKKPNFDGHHEIVKG